MKKSKDSLFGNTINFEVKQRKSRFKQFSLCALSKLDPPSYNLLSQWFMFVSIYIKNSLNLKATNPITSMQSLNADCDTGK